MRRTDAELQRSERFFGTAAGDVEQFSGLEEKRRLFNQPEWIANADLSYDNPRWGIKATLSYFRISDVLDAAGTASVDVTGNPETFTLDRYVGSFEDLRFTASKTFELPRALGELTFRGTVKNLTDSERTLIYDPDQTRGTIEEQEYKIGRDYSFSVTFKRRF